jgi:hypothetical protein
MARTKANTVQINIKLPAGIKVPRAVLAEATNAAQAIVSSQLQYHALSMELAAKGIAISASELAKRASGGKVVAKAAKSGGKRKRVVLTDAQRKQAVVDLKGGATIGSVASTYGCSPQTIMGLKKAAGLVKSKKAKKKAAKRG